MIDRITELRAQYRNKLLKKYDLGENFTPLNFAEKPATSTALSEEDQKLLDSIGEIGTLKTKSLDTVIKEVQNLNQPIVKAPKRYDKLDMRGDVGQQQLPPMIPAGDMSTNFYNFGRALGMKSGTKGRGMLGFGSLGAGLLGAARMTASGIGYSKANAYAQKQYRDNLIESQNQYTAASQTDNTNNVGGFGKFGGKFNERMRSFREGGFFHYLDGGEQEGEEEMMQMADNGNPGEVQQQNPQEEKIIQIAQQLVNGLGSLEAIDAYLREQEVDEQMYGAIMHIAEQMLGESEQEEDQGEEMVNEEEEQPEMNEGGEFNKNVGDFIEFEYEGKKYSGKISKIENGQIYL